MDAKQILNDIAGLYPLVVKIGKKDPDALTELNRLYKAVYETTVVAGCSGCHVKAYNRLTSLTLEDLLIMENAKFKLKKGVLLNFPFMSGDHYSREGGIPDRIAAQFLDSKPERVSDFELYPGSDSEDGALDLKEVKKLTKKDEAPKKEKGDKKLKIVEDENPEPVKKDKLDLPKKPISKMNVAELRAEYLDVLFSEAPEGASKKEMQAAISKELSK